MKTSPVPRAVAGLALVRRSGASRRRSRAASPTAGLQVQAWAGYRRAPHYVHATPCSSLPRMRSAYVPARGPAQASESVRGRYIFEKDVPGGRCLRRGARIHAAIRCGRAGHTSRRARRSGAPAAWPRLRLDGHALRRFGHHRRANRPDRPRPRCGPVMRRFRTRWRPGREWKNRGARFRYAWRRGARGRSAP